MEDTKERKGFSIPARRKRVVLSLSLSLVLVVLPQGRGGRASLNLDTQTRVLEGGQTRRQTFEGGGAQVSREGNCARVTGRRKLREDWIFSLAGRRAAATKRAAEKIEQGGNITGVRSSTGNNDIGIATKNDVAKRVPCIHPAY